jgi:hypothetical protein
MNYLDYFKTYEDMNIIDDRYNPTKGDYVLFSPSASFMTKYPNSRDFANKTGWITHWHGNGSYYFELEKVPQSGPKGLTVFYQISKGVNESPFIRVKNPPIKKDTPNTGYDPHVGERVKFYPCEEIGKNIFDKAGTSYLEKYPNGVKGKITSRLGWTYKFKPDDDDDEIVIKTTSKNCPFTRLQKKQEPIKTSPNTFDTRSGNINTGYEPKKGERVMFRPSTGAWYKKYPNGVKGVITKVYPDFLVSWGYEFLPDGEDTPIVINLGIFNYASVSPFVKLTKKLSDEEKGYEPQKRDEIVMFKPQNYLKSRYPNGVLVTVKDLWAGQNPNYRWYILVPLGGKDKDKIKIDVNRYKEKFPFEKYVEPVKEDEEVLRAEPVYCNGERIVKLVNMALPLFDDISDAGFKMIPSAGKEIDICMDKLNRLKKYFSQ